jgi:hypothetical protein
MKWIYLSPFARWQWWHLRHNRHAFCRYPQFVTCDIMLVCLNISAWSVAQFEVNFNLFDFLKEICFSTTKLFCRIRLLESRFKSFKNSVSKWGTKKWTRKFENCKPWLESSWAAFSNTRPIYQKYLGENAFQTFSQAVSTWKQIQSAKRCARSRPMHEWIHPS